MSYAEQKWTLDQIEKSDLGKDSYVAGILRGTVGKIVSGSFAYAGTLFEISGKGIVTNLSIGTDSSVDVTKQYIGTITLEVDDSVVATLEGYIYRTGRGSSSMNFSSDDIFTSEIPVHVPYNNAVKINKPIRFERNLRLSGAGANGVNTTFTYFMTYSLDENQDGGGLKHPKNKIKKFPGWDFRENVSGNLERGYAA